MSNTIRQSNIFGNYDWKIAYESFLEADYASYDRDTIYESMVDYIRKNYSEDFNDFIQHSELLAHVNMLAYLGQGYALKNDINSIENFMDDAKRRQSIINIASTLTYRPKRNVAASGMLKISSIQTTDDILDSRGNSLQNRRITWNQKGEPTWYDSFIKIIESSFKKENRFGRAYQRNNTQNTRLEIYELNQSPSESFVYPFEYTVNGTTLPFELVPSVLNVAEVIERTPSTNDPFTIIFQNNGEGNDSPTSGFFIQCKQGKLQNRDFFYTTPKIDRNELIDVTNVNNDDVWVQEVDENGVLIEYWHDIPTQSNQNIIFNEIDLNERNIYFTKSLSDDRIQILYGDGNFSRSPTNHMRVWVRQSANMTFNIRKHDMRSIPITIPYINREGKQQVLTVFLSNEDVIDNAETSESIEEIKENVIASHYQQNRMVTIEDYNVFPFQTNPLRKLRTVNRDNAGKGRFPFLDTRDPTGMHSNLFVNAVDGYIFGEYYELYRKFITDNIVINENSITQEYIEPLMQTEYFKTFYNNTVFQENYLENATVYNLADDFPRLYWKNRYITDDNRMGNIQYEMGDEWNNFEHTQYPIIREKSKLLFLHDKKEFWTTVISISDDYITTSDYVPSNAYLYMVIPSLNTQLGDSIKAQMQLLINRQESFGLRYDDIHGEWILIEQNNIVNTTEQYDIETPVSNISPDNRWLIKCVFRRDINQNFYEIVSRGTRIIFGSDRQVRFYFKNTDYVDDIITGLPALDNIRIIQDDETYGVSEFKPVHDEYVSTQIKTIEFLDDME